jgi:hypothetical protein
MGAIFSAPIQTGPGAHPASCTVGTGSFRGVESGQGVKLTPHPLLVPRPKERSRAIPLLSLRAFVACKKGETYLLRIKGLYMFRALLAHPQEVLHNSIWYIVCVLCQLAVTQLQFHWGWTSNARNRPLILNKLNEKCIMLVLLYWYTVIFPSCY